MYSDQVVGVVGGGVTIGNSSLSHQELLIGTGNGAVPASEIVDAVRFLAYLIKNHPEIRDLHIAFKAKEKVSK